MPKLIIIDDEPFTVDMLQTFLQINGYETVSAYNGEDGLVLTKVEHPAIMILDLMLPDIEGYEVCRRLRAYPDSAHIPVLILSARAESTSKERAMAAGADAYLTKPVKFPELLSEIKRLIDSGHRPADTNATPSGSNTSAPASVSKLTEIARTPLDENIIITTQTPKDPEPPAAEPTDKK